MNKIDELIIIGGGLSIKDGIATGLHDKLKNKFTFGLNYAFNDFDSTTTVFVDRQFYNEEKDKLKRLPLVIGRNYRGINNDKVENILTLKAGNKFEGTDSIKKGRFYKACYSKDTEVLTENGWKLLKDIVKQKQKIKVATLNPKINKVEYYYPTNYISFKYKGKMIHEKGRRIDLLVTPNHKMYIGKYEEYLRKKEYNYKFKKANKLPEYPIIYKKDFPYKGKLQKYFILPPLKNNTTTKNYISLASYYKSKKIKMDLWVEFLGWYLSEGCCIKLNKGNYRITISNCKYFDEIKSIIKKMKYKMTITYQNNCYTFTILNKQLWVYLKNNCGEGCYKKRIPRKLLNSLSRKQCQLLLHTLIKGDGNKTLNRLYYYTSSKQLADDVQELGLKCGYSCTLGIRRNKKNSYIRNRKINLAKYRYIVYFAKTKHTVIHNKKQKNRKKCNYNDYVYCLEVPNHIMYIRRNGKGVWSGNSLVGLFSLTIGINLLDSGNIYLLGFDFGKITNNRIRGEKITHYYQKNKKRKHRGTGKTSYYESKNREQVFDPYKKVNHVYIYNVSPNSNLNTFKKLNYTTFYKRLNNKKYNQKELRKMIVNKLYKVNHNDYFKKERYL